MDSAFAAPDAGRLPAWLLRLAEAQRGTTLLWAPVAFGIGVGSYFSLPVEPTGAVTAGVAALGLLGLTLALRFRVWGIMVLIALIPLGAGAAKWRTERAAAPVLAEEYFGPVIGRVAGVDRSPQNRLRLTLDRVQLPRLTPEETPDRVRIVLPVEPDAALRTPGARVMIRARLTPPPPPVEPGGFDFRRWAWFHGLGAIGYSGEPLVLAAPPPHDLDGLRLFALRMHLADWIRARMEPRSGGFAAAILTGERSGIDPADLDALRAANLAHLLAISGLHMGLLTGAVYFALRFGLVLIPGLALRWPVAKWAAVAALFAGAAYLALSGASVATQRAFIMATVIFTAILADRPAITLRSVAIAALIVLAWRPESLMGPGFQMSFAATTALVVVYAEISRRQVLRWQGILGWTFGLVMTSTVAGLATAPYSAFHFNQLTPWGLPANLAAVPAMGLLVMPAALAAFLLVPFGLEGLGFWVMGIGIDHILAVAQWVAARPEPVVPVRSGPAWVPALFTLGALGALLLAGPVRGVGAALASASLLGWIWSERPEVLVTEDGRLLGVMTEDGRALNRGRGSGFAARVWLENDGDAAEQSDAAARAGAEAFRVQARSGTVVYWVAKDALMPGCRRGTLIIAPSMDRAPQGPCGFLGKRDLAAGGAHAWETAGDPPRHAVGLAGQRPWIAAQPQ